jgi:hypothetical protein
MSAAAWQDQDDAGAAATAELRGETLVWQMLLHQARANLANLSAYSHDQIRRKALDAAADHLYAAEKLLRALDDVLDPSRTTLATACPRGTSPTSSPGRSKPSR